MNPLGHVSVATTTADPVADPEDVLPSQILWFPRSIPTADRPPNAASLVFQSTAGDTMGVELWVVDPNTPQLLSAGYQLLSPGVFKPDTSTIFYRLNSAATVTANQVSIVSSIPMNGLIYPRITAVSLTATPVRLYVGSEVI